MDLRAPATLALMNCLPLPNACDADWEKKPVLAVWRKAKTLARTVNQTTSPPSSFKQSIQFLL
jgi:hypothetical protein